MEIKITKLHPNAVTPFYATEGSNAMDLTAVSSQIIDSEHIKYNFGLAFEIPKGSSSK